MIRIRMSVLLGLESVVCFILGSATEHAQVAPLKPGLWQIQVERETNGEKTSELAERLKKMPTERRAQIEGMMKQRRVEPNGNTVKVCQTREMLEQQEFRKSPS